MASAKTISIVRSFVAEGILPCEGKSELAARIGDRLGETVSLSQLNNALNYCRDNSKIIGFHINFSKKGRYPKFSLTGPNGEQLDLETVVAIRGGDYSWINGQITTLTRMCNQLEFEILHARDRNTRHFLRNQARSLKASLDGYEEWIDFKFNLTWPPKGWKQHPQDGNYYFKGSKVLTKSELRKKVRNAALRGQGSEE